MKLKTLSIGTFNLFDLNEPNLPIYTQTAGWTPELYALKIEWAARQLKLLESDVFGFQKLWHATSLRNVLSASGLAAEYDLIAPPDANGSRVVCAALVRKGEPRAGMDRRVSCKLHVAIERGRPSDSVECRRNCGLLTGGRRSRMSRAPLVDLSAR